MAAIYTELAWTSEGDRGSRYQYVSKRKAMKAAAGDARTLRAKRVAPHSADEVARWSGVNGGGVVVYRD